MDLEIIVCSISAPDVHHGHGVNDVTSDHPRREEESSAGHDRQRCQSRPRQEDGSQEHVQAWKSLQKEDHILPSHRSGFRIIGVFKMMKHYLLSDSPSLYNE